MSTILHCSTMVFLIPSFVFLHSGHGSEVVEVGPRESVEISVFTRSTAGAKFAVHDFDKKIALIQNMTVKHNGTSDVTETPTSQSLTEAPIKGPIKVKVKADSLGSRFSTHNYLLVFTFKNTL